MKIYFTASSSYRNLKRGNCERIVNYLEKKGHQVFGGTLSENHPSVSEASEYHIRQWYLEWASYINSCDLVLIEGSYPSTIHIGFELGLILARAKPVILLFLNEKDPIYISEMYSTRLVKSEYTENNLEDVLKWCLDEVDHVLNRRFTFFISPDIESFLEEISKVHKISRSEYIRNLIEDKMKK